MFHKNVGDQLLFKLFYRTLIFVIEGFAPFIILPSSAPEALAIVKQHLPKSINDATNKKNKLLHFDFFFSLVYMISNIEVNGN